MWDAEDVVSEAMVRWLRVDQSEIREPVAYLTTMVSRIALDQLKSARVTRQSYIGPWLPEPALTASSDLGPLDTVELRESVSVATLHVMEQLTPPERGVFVLREAFEFPFAEIAEILDISEAERATAVSPRPAPHRGARPPLRRGPEEHATLLDDSYKRWSPASSTNWKSSWPSEAVVYSDGGGKHRAAIRPVTGRANIVKFFRGLVRRFDVGEVRVVEANGRAAAVFSIGRQTELLTIEVHDHAIHAIYGIVNPDKLTYVEQQISHHG